MIRSFLERTTYHLSFQRRLPAEYGRVPLVVTPSAGLRYLLRSMTHADPILCALAKQYVHSNAVVWDVGANIGLFSFLSAHFAGAGGRVFSFEPDTWLVQLLRRTRKLQSPASAPVTVVPVAIADSVEIREFNIAQRSRSTNFISGYGSSQTGDIAETQTVLSVSLDWLSARLPAPDVLKIDVEGAELEVLKGASRLLTEIRPVILCEVCSARSPEVTSLLHAHGYRLFDGEVPQDQRREVQTANWSTVAIPDSK